MFEPRPDISIATRLRSRIVGCGPVLIRGPRACLAGDRAAVFACFDAANFERVEHAGNRTGLAGRDDHRHADATVEGPRHLLGRKASPLLQQSEDGRQVPEIRSYLGMGAVRQNSRNILEKSAPGNVCESLDLSLLDKREEGPDIDFGGLQQRLSERFGEAWETLSEVPSILLDDLSNQREAVAVNPGAGET